MGIFTGMNISASALTAQRLRMDVISNNIANMDTTNTGQTTPAGNPVPYRRQVTVFQSRPSSHQFSTWLGKAKQSLSSEGVQVAAIREDPSPLRLEYDPDSPDAVREAEPGVPVGYVRYPNVNIVTEIIDMISASRSYEANVTALNASKAMAAKALEIGKE
ncbi:MAG: flagellar basal body rod protein FlgC [Bacillota bacterium]|jgi:flagellar basal-body rod protein FlgC|nr:flagellar basal body rod protein FlgC [Clostridia bacterium]